MSASLGIYDDVVGGEHEVELKEDTEWCLWFNERLANLVLITAKAHQPRLVLRADKCYRNGGAIFIFIIISLHQHTFPLRGFASSHVTADHARLGEDGGVLSGTKFQFSIVGSLAEIYLHVHVPQVRFGCMRRCLTAKTNSQCESFHTIGR